MQSNYWRGFAFIEMTQNCLPHVSLQFFPRVAFRDNRLAERARNKAAFGLVLCHLENNFLHIANLPMICPEVPHKSEYIKTQKHRIPASTACRARRAKFFGGPAVLLNLHLRQPFAWRFA